MPGSLPTSSPSANYRIDTANRIDPTTPIQQAPRRQRALRRLVAAGYATLEVEQVNPAELKRPRRTYYRLTEAGRLWAAAAARLVVWRRTINLQEAEAPVTVSIVYLPVGGGDIQGQEAWRVELSGDLCQLTAGDASSVALLLGAAAEEVVAAGQSPPSSRDHRWMRRMRGGERTLNDDASLHGRGRRCRAEGWATSGLRERGAMASSA
jgi:hypothetical protein